MRPQATEIPGVFWIEPVFFEDDRGRFRRSFCDATLTAIGIDFPVRQCNLSENLFAGTLRGFHWQEGNESKLLTCVAGVIHDIVVDLRENSPSFGKWLSFEMSAKNGLSLRVPPGCANAWITLQDNTSIHYWHSDIYRPEAERGMRYNDPAFAFVWPMEPKVISQKDLSHPNFLKKHP